jgi:hypothetical protein
MQKTGLAVANYFPHNDDIILIVVRFASNIFFALIRWNNYNVTKYMNYVYEYNV